MPLGVDDNFNFYLYKYRSFEGNSIKYLERLFLHSELKFSAPATFNDPFECRPLYILEGSIAEKRAHYEKLYEQYGRELPRKERRQLRRSAVKAISRKTSEHLEGMRQDTIEIFTQKLGIFCLTKEPDNILMWSHYAADHTGICLEFHGHVDAPFFLQAQKVNYQQAYPAIDMVRMTREEKMTQALLTKAQMWDYEKEWRIIETRKGPCVQVFPSGQLSAVIFGLRISREHEALVRSWAQQMPHTPALYQAQMKTSEYGLEIVPV